MFAVPKDASFRLHRDRDAGRQMGNAHRTVGLVDGLPARAVRELLEGTAVERYLVGWIVLAVAFCAEGVSLLQSLALTRREAAMWGESALSFLRHTSEPTLRAIVVEDTAALIGLLLAAGGLLLHQFAGLARADAIAALLIGPQFDLSYLKARPKDEGVEEARRIIHERLIVMMETGLPVAPALPAPTIAPAR